MLLQKRLSAEAVRCSQSASRPQPQLNDVASMLSPCCGFCSQAEEAHKDRQATQHRVSVLKKQVASRDRSIEDLHSQLKAAADDLKVSQDEAKSASDQAQQLQQGVSKAQQQVQATKEHYQKGTDHQIEALRGSLAEARTDLEAAWVRHSQENARAAELQACVARLEEQALQLDEKLSQAHNDLDAALDAQQEADARAAGLASELATAQADAAELSSKLKASEEKAETLEAGFSSQTGQLQELTEQLGMASELGQQAEAQHQQQSERLAQAEAAAAAGCAELEELHEIRAQLEDR